MPASNAFCRDCMEAMREFPDGFFDLAVVDPPYGINVTGLHTHTHSAALVGGGPRPFGGNKHARHACACPSTFYHAFDDSSPPDADYFRELARIAKHRVIWGANFFLDHLGRASCMIIWDKCRRGMDQADCEIAWTDFPGQSRIFEFRWNGMLQGDPANKETRIHPTQKPVALYKWIFSRYAKPGDKILDTHLGSGSSRIAAWDAGLDFWGYEILPVFYELQEKRFQTHANQINLFL